MAAIGFIYAWQKLYPVLIFRSVVFPQRGVSEGKSLGTRLKNKRVGTITYEVFVTSEMK